MISVCNELVKLVKLLSFKWLLQRQEPGLQPPAVTCNVQSLNFAASSWKQNAKPVSNTFAIEGGQVGIYMQSTIYLPSVADLSTSKEIHMNYSHSQSRQNLMKQEFLHKQLLQDSNLTTYFNCKMTQTSLQIGCVHWSRLTHLNIKMLAICLHSEITWPFFLFLALLGSCSEE